MWRLHKVAGSGWLNFEGFHSDGGAARWFICPHYQTLDESQWSWCTTLTATPRIVWWWFGVLLFDLYMTFLKPTCSGLSFSSTVSFSRSRIMQVNTLLGTDSSMMPRQFLQDPRSPFLGSFTRCPFFPFCWYSSFPPNLLQYRKQHADCGWKVYLEC